MATTLDGDVHVRGQLSAQSQVLPASSVGNSQVQATAGISASKVQQQHLAPFSQSGNAVAATEMIYQQHGATGTVEAFKVSCLVIAGSGGSCTVDLKKNGTTILTGTVSLGDTDAAYTLKSPGGYTSQALVAGDVLTVVVGDITGTVPQGVFAQAVIHSDPA